MHPAVVGAENRGEATTRLRLSALHVSSDIGWMPKSA